MTDDVEFALDGVAEIKGEGPVSQRLRRIGK